MSRYLHSLNQINPSLKERRNRKEAIRRAVDAHIRNCYGITDFSQKLRKGILEPLGIDPVEADKQGKSFGMLARQIPSICAEDVACHCLAQRIGLTPLSMAFTRDAFIPGGNDKVRRAKVPFVAWSKKGALQLTHETVVDADDDSLHSLNMVRMDRIRTKPEFGGTTLAAFHRAMHQNLFGHFTKPGLWGDISTLYGAFLAESIESGHTPRPLWKTNHESRDTAWEGPVTSSEALELIVRPSSKWYYELYLSMFLDGTFVLLETYDNEEGGVPLARALFERTVDAIELGVGCKPVVVKTSPLSKDMLYVNRAMIQDPERTAAFMERQAYWETDTVRMSRWFADRAIQFC